MGNGPNVDNQHWENSFMAQGATPWNEKQLTYLLFSFYLFFTQKRHDSHLVYMKLLPYVGNELVMSRFGPQAMR